MTLSSHVLVLGQGHADGPFRERDGVRTGLVRYADPASWTIVSSIVGAFGALEDSLRKVADNIGIITVSNHGPRETIHHVFDGSQRGVSSPLRFAAANPGSLAGLACTAFGFRGPSLNLSMSVEHGTLVALNLATSWLARRSIDAVVIATCAKRHDMLISRSLILIPVGSLSSAGLFELSCSLRWLTFPGDDNPPEGLRGPS